ncbi:MAG: aldehyde dehydrogenase family protein, partial [Akkermansiaceae bacterium]|nr:aldehyde dehydrogenase family protein [Akkermansiaceae bacterium]
MNGMQGVLQELGLSDRNPGWWCGPESRPGGGPPLASHSPVDGRLVAEVGTCTAEEVAGAVASAGDAFRAWRVVPAPVRGELVRRYAEVLRANKQRLGSLVSWEMGKITAEAEGEVQEMIDICDFAVGLSRQLYGLTIASERPAHRLTEQWHPLGPVGVISAFNFPVAVWCWNAALALVCGDPVVWKPSEKTPLCALACHQLLLRAARDFAPAPDGLSSVVVGGREAGEALAAAPGLPLVSATGSVPMGRAVAAVVGERLGRSLLELGGNNALILAPSADLELAIRAIVFSAVGTAGQRCTSLRRLIVHESIAPDVVARLKKVYAGLPIGSPVEAGTLVGPLIDRSAVEIYERTLALAEDQGGVVSNAGRLEGNYVRPALVEIDSAAPSLRPEACAPIRSGGTSAEVAAAIALPT